MPSPNHEAPNQEMRAPCEWSRWIAQIAQGDEGAMASLYDDSSSVVHGIIRRILADREVADEVTLDVYMHVWKSADRFDAERGSAMTWLLMIARSRALDRLRADKNKQRESPIEEAAELPLDGPTPDASALVDEERQRIRAAMDRLQPEQRRLIEIAWFGGLSHRQIAEKLGQPLGTVKARIRAGMLQLRTSLAPLREAT